MYVTYFNPTYCKFIAVDVQHEVLNKIEENDENYSTCFYNTSSFCNLIAIRFQHHIKPYWLFISSLVTT